MEKRLEKSMEIAVQRAERIKYLRKKLLDLSRPKFANKHGIAKGSLQNWEDVRYGGLTENGAYQLVRAFQAEGINCTVDWLLHGIGETPVRQTLLDTFLLQPEVKADETMLAEELQVFYRLHQNAVDAIVSDDALSPCYMPGYHVAGEKLFSHDINKAVGLPCIVQTQTGMLLIRMVQKGTIPEHYTLTCTNPETNELDLTDIKLFSAAPIIWIRKPKIR